MTGSYHPQENSVADRALTYLEQLGAGREIEGPELARQLGVRLQSLPACLLKAVQTGRVIARRANPNRSTSPIWYSIPPDGGLTLQETWRTALCGTRAPDDEPTQEDAGPVPARDVLDESTTEVELNERVTQTCSQPDERVRASAQSFIDELAQAAPKLRIALWSDGALQIQRGSSELVLDQDETRRLLDYLDRLRPQEGAA